MKLTNRHKNGRCPYCKRSLQSGGPIGRDHIHPRRRGGTLVHHIHTNEPIGNNFRVCHLSCNNLKERAGDCIGALSCAIAVAEGTRGKPGFSSNWTRSVGGVLHKWRLERV